MDAWFLAALALVACTSVWAQQAGRGPARERAVARELPLRFQTSDRCFPCHNGMTTQAGEPFSIGVDWRSSIMANASRDPYWQASVRRETIDHAGSRAGIESECAICHMPMPTYTADSLGEAGEVFAYLPFGAHAPGYRFAQDGVSCSVCHQITPQDLGNPRSYDGGFHIGPPTAAGLHQEFGPFDVTGGRMRVMRTSSGGFQPDRGDHIRSAELCATCHTLITRALGPGGRIVGELDEQMPYPEWLHSDFRSERSCQSCHMPAVEGETDIAHVLGVPRAGARRHVFVAADFIMQEMLGRYHDELAVAAPANELAAAAQRTIAYLQSRAARISIAPLGMRSGRLEADVTVVNLAGHKLPTAYPSRRAWLHVVVRDGRHRTIFESGALNPDGSIRGNDNDADPSRFEPHYAEIRSPDQVQIYEPILRDAAGRVTTGLLSAVGYLKDNRLLPRGFDKRTADTRIAVVGRASQDPDFTGGGDRIRYSVDVRDATGPFEVDAELRYQPIGFRWAHNLDPYAAAETKRFTTYYRALRADTAVILARASAQWHGPTASHGPSP